MRKYIIAVSVGLILASAPRAVCGADAQFFAEPNGWSLGDPNSSYQEWDVLMQGTDNMPDVGSLANPSRSFEPKLSVVAPGFVSSSANFYSYSGEYSVDALVTSSLEVRTGYGTHVIVQTAANINSDIDTSVYIDSLEIVGPAGEPITGGGSGERLRAHEIWRGIVSSFWGQVTQQEVIWEFYLPNYTGDFRVRADVAIHSRFSALRIDTMAAQQPFAVTSVLGPYELDGDGVINFHDYALFSADRQSGCSECAADFNNDGAVDDIDLRDFAKHWLEGNHISQTQ